MRWLDLAALPAPAEILPWSGLEHGARRGRALSAACSVQRTAIVAVARGAGRDGARPGFRRLVEPARERRADRRRGRRREDATAGARDPRAPRGRAGVRPGHLPRRLPHVAARAPAPRRPGRLGAPRSTRCAARANGFGPLRGFRRLDLRFFGADVAPPTQVYDAALRAEARRDRGRRQHPAPRGVDRAARAARPRSSRAGPATCSTARRPRRRSCARWRA